MTQGRSEPPGGWYRCVHPPNVRWALFVLTLLQELKEKQETPDPPEALACIPSLHLSGEERRAHTRCALPARFPTSQAQRRAAARWRGVEVSPCVSL